MNNNSFILSIGIKPILITVVLVLLSYLFICNTFSFLLLLLALFFIYSYRNSSRHIFANKEHLLAPVDSKVIAIDYQDTKVDIYCQINPTGLKKVFAPIDGLLEVKKYFKGANLDPLSYKGKLLNTQIEYKLESVDLKIISGKCSMGIEALKESKDIKQGDTIALCDSGIVVISLERTQDINVQLNENIVAGQTKLYK